MPDFFLNLSYVLYLLASLGFIRTPKRGTSSQKSYRPKASPVPYLEIAAGLYCTVSLVVYARSGNFAIVPFLSLYVAGFSLVGWSSLIEQLHGRKS